MKEKDYIHTFMPGFKENSWWYKIPDNRYTGKKPFDVFGYSKDGPFALEFKFHKSLEVWLCSTVSEYQRQSLKAVAAQGVDARVILGIRFLLATATQKAYNYKWRCFSLDVSWPIAEFEIFREKNAALNIRDLLIKGLMGYADGKSL